VPRGRAADARNLIRWALDHRTQTRTGDKPLLAHVPAMCNNRTIDDKKKYMTDKTNSPKKSSAAKPRCGLCGKTNKLTRTECCGEWICDDEDEYVLFSYATNSCHRNHRRYTLCGSHHAEGHAGDWKDCPKCRDEIETELYVYYGTNEYNFEKLVNPPQYEPKHCKRCGRVILLGEGGYLQQGKYYWCSQCSAKEMGRITRRTKRST